MAIDHKKLAVIHIVKRELCLSDDEYRDLLERETGVRSARDLDGKGFKRLMRYFTSSSHYRLNKFGLTLRQKLFIQHLLHDLGWDRRHFKNFLNKYFKKTEINELTKKEASNLIESLKNILSRERLKQT
jgi:hypothetical protein